MSDGATGRGPQQTPTAPGAPAEAPPPAFPSFGPPPPAAPTDSNGWTRPDATEPDWAALADRNEEQARRRKRLRNAGAIVGAALLVGGITTTAILLGNRAEPGATPDPPGVARTATATAVPSTGAPDTPSPPAPAPSGTASPSPSVSVSVSASTKPSPSASPSRKGTAGPSASATPGASGTPNASAPPAPPSSTAPPDPLTVISSATTDIAPLDANSLFSATTLTADGKSWTRTTTAPASPCWTATTGGLGNVISAQGCQTLLRATYTSGNSSVTIGVAVFAERANADAAAQAHQGQVQGLVPAGNIAYCTSEGCTNTHAAVGRYTYYTVSGTVKPGGTTADPAATAAAPSFAAHTRTRLLARGTR